MAQSFDFIKADTTTAPGSLPAAVDVSSASLASTTRGTPLSAYIRPPSKSIYPASDVSWSYSEYTTSPNYTAQKTYTWQNTTRFRTSCTMSFVAYSGDAGGCGYSDINGAVEHVGKRVGYSIEFNHYGTDFAIAWHKLDNSDWIMLIDDQPLTVNWQHPGVNDRLWIHKIHFNSLRVRNIRLIVSQDTGLHSIILPGAADIWQAPRRYRVAISGDSYVQGVGATSDGAIGGGTIAGELAYQTGWEVWNLGQYGTGYVSDGSIFALWGYQRYGGARRVSALAAVPSPDLVIIYGGGNDSTFSPADVVANANAAWTALKSAQPNVPMIVPGIESITTGGWGSQDAAMNAINVATKAAALAHPSVHAYIDQRSAPTWMPGTGYDGAKNGTGISDIMICQDSTHPLHAGFRYTVMRLVEELGKIRV